MRFFNVGYEIPHAEENVEPHTYEEVDYVLAAAHKEPVYQNKSIMENPIKLHELASYIDEVSKRDDSLKQEFDVSILCAFYLILMLDFRRCIYIEACL